MLKKRSTIWFVILALALIFPVLIGGCGGKAKNLAQVEQAAVGDSCTTNNDCEALQFEYCNAGTCSALSGENNEPVLEHECLVEKPLGVYYSVRGLETYFNEIEAVEGQAVNDLGLQRPGHPPPGFIAFFAPENTVSATLEFIYVDNSDQWFLMECYDVYGDTIFEMKQADPVPTGLVDLVFPSACFQQDGDMTVEVRWKIAGTQTPLGCIPL